MKKKIFLGAYLNSTNAQNLNCLALAKYLNQEKYQIFALHLYSGNLINSKLPHVTYFNCIYPHRISRFFAYLWGIWHCDIAYLPKRELPRWNYFLLKLLRKKSFITVEGIIKNSKEAVLYQNAHKAYAITHFVREHTKLFFSANLAEQVLYIGVDSSIFKNPIKNLAPLTDVIFIGRLKKRKGIEDILFLAKQFSSLKFHIVGDGEDLEKAELLSKIQSNYQNIIVHGLLSHQNLSSLLKNCQLHVFPSRDEGFGKVTIETAAAGVPSIVYSDYGAGEWIDNGKNGFVVTTIEEVCSLINNFLINPSELFEISKNALKLSQKFEWENLIPSWENAIDQLA